MICVNRMNERSKKEMYLAGITNLFQMPFQMTQLIILYESICHNVHIINFTFYVLFLLTKSVFTKILNKMKQESNPCCVFIILWCNYTSQICKHTNVKLALSQCVWSKRARHHIHQIRHYRGITFLRSKLCDIVIVLLHLESGSNFELIDEK